MSRNEEITTPESELKWNFRLDQMNNMAVIMTV